MKVVDSLARLPFSKVCAMFSACEWEVRFSTRCSTVALRMLLLLLLQFCSIVYVYCSGSSKPHIVFILADDLGWNDVSFHGSKQIPTPNIDLLAQDGIILSNYYVSPLCSPSRGSLLTGKYAIKIGLQHYVIPASGPWGLPLEEKTLPQYLNELGYVSHGVGKWHLGFFEKEYLPTGRGFKSFFGYWTGMEDYYTHFNQHSEEGGLDFHHNEDNEWGFEGYYSTEIFTSRAKDIIKRHNSSQPLFLYLAHQAVHSGNAYSSLQVPEEYIKPFSYIKDEARRKYAGMVSALDVSVGEILESLDKSKMLENTIIVFSTDNGGSVEGIDGNTASNWPLRGSKYTLWEGGVRGICWIWSSALRRKSRIEHSLFHVTDWVPTLYSAAGGDLQKLAALDGFNQWSTISKGEVSPRKEILHNIDEEWKMEAVRWGHYKLVNGSYSNGDFDGWFDQQGKRSNDTSLNKALTENEKVSERIVYLSQRKRSKVAQIFFKNFGKDITDQQKNMLEDVVKCGLKPANASTNCRPMESPCLFDILKDPCEYQNIADVFPKVVTILENLLSKYKKESVEPRNKPNDPEANPKYHYYAWVPWKSPGSFAS